MPGRRAKILSAADVGDLLVFASCTRHPSKRLVHEQDLGIADENLRKPVLSVVVPALVESSHDRADQPFALTQGELEHHPQSQSRLNNEPDRPASFEAAPSNLPAPPH